MRLQSLRLKNFKGIRGFNFTPEGKSVTVFADNEVGKTTLFDALTWLLFDKDSLGRSTNYFTIKTEEDGQVIHDIDHEVKGIFDSITLKKIYRENWVTKRGNSTPELKGHETKHYVDDVPCSMTEYQYALSEIMSEEQFKILSNPMHFPEVMHWTDRRKVLLDICGEITDEEIIASNEELFEYDSILDGKDQDQRQKMLKERRKKLDKELDNIPSRLDELNGRLYEVNNLEQEKTKAEEFKKKKGKIEAKKSEVESGGRVAELKVKKQELEAEKATLRNEHQQANEELLKDARKKVSARQDSLDEIEPEFRDAKREYEKFQSELEQKEQSIESIENRIESIQNRKPKEDSGQDICPMCEQPIEGDSEHNYQDYVEEFNGIKADDLKDAKQELRNADAERGDILNDLEQAKKKAANVSGKLNQRKQALEKAQAELNQQKESRVAFENTDECLNVVDEITDVDGLLANQQEEKKGQLDKLQQAIDDLDKQIKTAEETIHHSKENQRTNKRIKELKDQQKEYATQLETVEHHLYVIEKFIIEESRIITEKVNDLFDLVQWKLFEEQINGGIKQICTATVGGIPFDGGLNNGSRIKAGLDVINTLSNYYSKSAPCFVDNAEGVTSLPDNDLQVICLFVNREDKELRVEQGLPKHNLLTATV